MAINMTEEEKALNAKFLSNSWNAFNNQDTDNSFYESQLQSLINQDSEYRQNANEAKAIRETAANASNTPFVSSIDNWDWAYGGQGIPEVQTTPFDSPEGGASSSYTLGYGLNNESSNLDIMNATKGLDAFDNELDQQKFRDWSATTGEGDPSTMFDWANITNPEEYTLGLSDEQLAPDNKAWFNKILNSIYTSDALPNAAPAGYANPSVSGYANPTNNTGAN